jgi:iron(III) transport system ATP-binding protein
MSLQLEHVSVHLAQTQGAIVDDVSLQLARGEIGVLMGPSGCGKTTLIRTIAGLERVSQGSIRVDGDTLSTAQHHAAPQTRGLGMVFQDYALFPHLSVADNVGFGLSAWSGARRRERVQAVLDQVHLSRLAQRMPHQLSGGQQQRVALARALAPQPRLLLMDEPFSNLDRALRESLALELRDMLKAAGVTVLIVTHDLDEAFALGDRVGVMQSGRLLQWDRAETLYHQPQEAFVAEFTGPGAWIQGHALTNNRLQTALGVLDSHHEVREDTDYRVLLRASDVLHDPAAPMRAQVIHRLFKGDHDLLELRLPDQQVVLAQTASDARCAVGEHIGIRVRAERVAAMPWGDTGA